MIKKINKKFLYIILIFIFLVLISAYIIEYKLGHKPCKLCIYERVPYFLSILLIVEILFFKKHEKITLLILSLIFISSFGLSVYHVGIEQGIFLESLVCEGKNLEETLSKEQLLDQLKQNAVSCKDVSFKILGLSLASINSIFSLILSVIFMRLFLNYGKNK